ncbi:MAG: M2 family metallopeptidase [Rhabdochlamydiaceae bacterium]|nr:M2 family metallopeptidase [Rhabdochlamydiaceae bacterium]
MLKQMLLSILLSLGLVPAYAKEPTSFESFLNAFVPEVSSKSKQLNQAYWILATTGSADAADLVGTLSTELSMLFNNPKTYKLLLKWEKQGSVTDPILKRQLQLLIYSFKEKAIPENLLKEIAQKEAALSYAHGNFRANLQGKTVSENDILEVLKKETNPSVRKEAWEASKEVGQFLAPQILELVKLRNKAAKSLGYENYFQMQLDLQEVNEKALFDLLDQVASRSDESYQNTLITIEEVQCKQFSVPGEELGPWAWSEPFGQEDPLDRAELDSLVAHTDLVEATRQFYQKMGFQIEPILQKSDLWEKPGKNQHAFCINVDRDTDIRTLENLKPTLKWLETILHEFGHAIYEQGFDEKLPWLLKQPPHMITTEAMALMAGRRAYLISSLSKLPSYTSSQDTLIKKAQESLSRRQLIFSRWVLVMTYFERELYRNPDQDLNTLWWSLVSKYQKIRTPKNRDSKCDWAAKYHIGLAPVYYYSYLLGELFASCMEESLQEVTGSNSLETTEAGRFLREKLFSPGNRMNWSQLIEHVIGKPLSSDAWIREFATKQSSLPEMGK